MKLFSKNSEARYGTFSLSRGVPVYILLLLFAVIFTQALRSPVSVVFLWFIAMLPVISFFYALIGRANIGAFVLSDETTVEKLTPVGYEFRVSNYSFLPMPFTEAEIFIPTSSGVSCESMLVSMSILPRGEYHFKSEVMFRYRGSYRVGVGNVYVTDPLRIFRLRRSVNIYSKIYVMPRRIVFPRDDEHSPSDTPTDSRVTEGSESSESNLIREYRNGDPLKHIHWKLSSKMQDLQVNDFKPNSGKNVYIFCDFATLFRDSEEAKKRRSASSGRNKKTEKKLRQIKVKLQRRPIPHELSTEEKREAREALAADKAMAAAAVSKFREELLNDETDEHVTDSDDVAVDVETAPAGSDPEGYAHANEILDEALPDHDAFCADGISEIAIGTAMHELDCGNAVNMMWFDERADYGFFSYAVRTHADIDTFFRQFGTAPVCPPDKKVTLLPSLLDDTDSPTFIFVTAAAGIAELGDYISASRGAGAERAEVLLFDPKERFLNLELHEDYVDLCRIRYAENKITLTTVGSSWETER